MRTYALVAAAAAAVVAFTTGGAADAPDYDAYVWRLSTVNMTDRAPCAEARDFAAWASHYPV